MPIHVTCPSCGFIASVADAQAGGAGRCHYCGSRVEIPAPPTPVDSGLETLPWPGADAESAVGSGSLREGPSAGEVGGSPPHPEAIRSAPH